MSRKVKLVESAETPPTHVYYRVRSGSNGCYLGISEITGTGVVSVQFTMNESSTPELIAETEWQNLLINSSEQSVSGDHCILSIPAPMLYRFTIPPTMTALSLGVTYD